MSNTSRQSNRVTRGLVMNRPKWITLGVLLAVVMAIGLWVMPRKTGTWVSVNGEHEWKDREAPPRRRIVWQPADSVTPLGVEAGAGNSLIRPQIDNDGQTLYFTLRSNELQKDIFRSRLVAGVWQDAEGVAELNTEFDDIGPVISPDGETLYLYSNRAGGHGGFDIYMSTRDGDSWTTPQNLGDRINSPAHEYDPAFDEQHKQLFFASNRSPKMHRLIREGKLTKSSDAWKTTLRADLGLNKFDLYVAQLETTAIADAEKANADAQKWTLAEPLVSVSRPASNEGAPFVGNHGSFLYYVSDQTFRDSEEANFDIYRARIEGPNRLSAFENLGPGVNTAENEIEPALSEEGFRIYFSRNGSAENLPSEEYSLYASTAIEVQQSSAWDDSNLKALMAGLYYLFIHNLFWWILAALLALLVLAIYYYSKQVSAGRATVPVFLLCALLFHLFLGLGSFYVMFGGKLQDLPDRVREIFVATKVESEQLHQSHDAGQQEYEKINDLKSVETVEPEIAERKIAETPNVPVPTESIVPSIPAQLSEATPIDRPETPVVRPAPSPSEPVILERKNPLQRMLVDASVALEETVEPAEATPPTSQTPTAASVQDPLARSTTTPTPQPEILNRKPTLPATSIAQEVIEPERVESTPSTPQATPQNPLQRTQQLAKIEPDLPTEVELENTPNSVPAAAVAVPTPTTTEQVNVQRANVPVPTSNTSPIPLQRRPLTTEVASAIIESLPDPSSETNDTSAPRFREINSPLADRQLNREVSSPTADTQIETEEVAVSSATGSANEVAIASINVSTTPRQNIADTSIQAPQTNTGLPTRLPPSVALDATPIDRAETASSNNVPVQSPTDNPLSRNRLATAGAEAPAEEVATVGLTVVEPNAPAVNPLGGASQNVDIVKKDMLQGSVAMTPNAIPNMKVTSLAKIRATVGDASPTTDYSNSAPATQKYVDSPFAKRQTDTSVRPTDSLGVIETVALTSVDASGAGDNADSKVSGVDVRLAQANGVPFSVGLPTDMPLGGRHAPSRPDLSIGALARVDVDTPVSGGPFATQLARSRALAPELQYAEDNIGMQALLKLRQSGGEAKKDLIKAFGGDDETLAAIKRGLNWLAMHQHEDGRWSLNKFHEECKANHEGGECNGAGTNCDTAGTGFALLPFLGDGQTHTKGEYQEQVRKGLKWLMDHQKGNGDLYTGGDGNSHMYSHGVATIALCEAYALTDDLKVKHHAQKAIDFIVASQNKTSGGWRYRPGDEGDTSVLGWQIMALKSGQMGGLQVPDQSIELAKKWIDRVSGKDNKFGQFGYTNSGDTKLAMTGEALLVLQYMGTDRNDPRLIAGAEHLLKNKPQINVESSYYWYYGTQFMYHMQGRYWDEWNTNMSAAVLKQQIAKDGQLGSWDPKDQWESKGGRIYSTALRVLMLEVYYRHLPLYQLIDE